MRFRTWNIRNNYIASSMTIAAWEAAKYNFWIGEV
jgi:hypothetical protein